MCGVVPAWVHGKCHKWIWQPVSKSTGWYLNFYPQCNWLMVNAHDPLNLVYLNALRFGSFTTITKPNELDQHCDKKYGIYFPFQWITFNKIHTKMQFWCFKLYMLSFQAFSLTHTSKFYHSNSLFKWATKKETFVSSFDSFIEQLETFSQKVSLCSFPPIIPEFLRLSEGINFKTCFFSGKLDNQNL